LANIKNSATYNLKCYLNLLKSLQICFWFSPFLRKL